MNRNIYLHNSRWSESEENRNSNHPLLDTSNDSFALSSASGNTKLLLKYLKQKYESAR